MAADTTRVGDTRRLLLATDLSCRCDRALGRAALLSKLWHAELLAMHVLEEPQEPVYERQASELPSWRRTPDWSSWVERKLRADLLEHVPAANVIVARGDPGNAILGVAAQCDVDLVLTGVPRTEAFNHLLSGATVNSLIRNAKVPVLVVKNRPRSEYRTIVLPTDFSETSQHALCATLRLFPNDNVILFHAFQMSGWAVPRNEHSATQFREMAELEAWAFLTKCGVAVDLDDARVKFVIESGEAGWLLRDYVRAKNVDLVVLGTHGRSALMEVFVSSTAKRILEIVPCDVMVVRQP